MGKLKELHKKNDDKLALVMINELLALWQI
jgi:hypothetical protein